MKIIVDLEASEVQTVQEIVNRFVPNFKLELGHKEKNGAFGSASSTVFGDRINLFGRLDSRIIPGVWKVVDKYSIQISGIIMMAKGLFQTYASVAAGLVQDVDGFIQDFKKQAKEDKPKEEPEVVDKSCPNPFEHKHVHRAHVYHEA